MTAKELVYDAIKSFGSHGLTDPEIGQLTGLKRATVSLQRFALHRLGSRGREESGPDRPGGICPEVGRAGGHLLSGRRPPPPSSFVPDS